MKIVCSQIDLKNSLSLVSRAVPSRPTHPILGNILLVANEDNNTITLTGFDLSLGIRTNFVAEVKEEGTITLPAKLFSDIIARLPEGEITLSYDENELDENLLVNIKSSSGKFQLRGVTGEEFPELPTVKKEEAFLLPISALIEGLKGSLSAVSNDDTKQILTGVHLNRTSDSLEFASTDGHRLAVVKTSVENADDINFNITIHGRILKELEKIIANTDKNNLVSFYVYEGQIFFEVDNHYLTSRKLEGAYPNYHQLIPTDFERTMIIDRKELITKLEQVAVFADEKNKQVIFTLEADNNQIILEVDGKELGNAKASVSAEITGEDFEIGFNLKYLMDGLKVLSANKIKFELNGATQPVILTPIDGLKMTYLIMPLQIKK